MALSQNKSGDAKNLAEETYKADLTINAADCDDEQLCQTILGAFKKKVADGKPKGVFLHTSGTMLFNDASAGGKRIDGKYWNVSSYPKHERLFTEVLNRMTTSLT